MAKTVGNSGAQGAQPASRRGPGESAPPAVWLLGGPQEAVLRGLIHADDVKHVIRIVAAAAGARTPYAVEYRVTAPDATMTIVQECGFFPSADGASGYATVLDVTERRRVEEANWRAAHFDALTHLPNRKFFSERILDAIDAADAHDPIVAVLVCNINKFRETNAMFGREIGNRLLMMLGTRLAAFAGSTDAVAHLGLDIFGILIAGVDARSTVESAARGLIAAVAEPFVIDAQPYHLSVSVGMSAAPDDGTDPALLLRSAYAALSTAKHSTRNAFCWYSEEMSADAASSGRLRNELRAAIESGELVLHYQPIVDVARDRIVAVEALVRWNHPRRGLLGPADFIELADRTGLIMPLGEWVLREACRQGREWCRLGFDLHVSVNVSAVQFRQPNFVARVAAILAQSGLRPDLLELELTESVMVDGVDEMIETLGRLKVLGLRLAIDDFGTGYSSLAYLKHFPVNTLKIDRAFVTNIARDGFDRAIATAVAALAAELHFDYVVEGVETTEQLEILRDIGCTMMQGYYFARPVPPGEIDVMLDKPLLAGRPNR